MTVIYYEDAAQLDSIQDHAIGVIGYNAQARSIALNLRDSGLQVVIGGSAAEQEAAQMDGFTTDTAAKITYESDLILLLMNDEDLTNFYIQEIAPNLHRGNALLFTSAYSITFGFIEPPPFVDVALISPRITGDQIRKFFEQGKGFPSFVAVWQDASRKVWPRVLGIALAMGALRAGAIEVNFIQEAELSLFVQQSAFAFLVHLLTTAADLLTNEGYPAEAILTDLYLSGRFHALVNQAADKGLSTLVGQQTKTEQYGALSKQDRFHALNLERLMEISLQEIRSGAYAKEWNQDSIDGLPRLNKLINRFLSNDLWDLEQQTLDLIGEPPPLDEDFESL